MSDLPAFPGPQSFGSSTSVNTMNQRPPQQQQQHHHQHQQQYQPSPPIRHGSTSSMNRPLPPGPPGPPSGINPQLARIFESKDSNRDGQLTPQELAAALFNWGNQPFDPRTVDLMISVFDVNRSGTISLTEFAALWQYLDEWRAIFERFDANRSGTIDFNEFSTALSSFGYRLSPQFKQYMFHTFDRQRRNQMSFDQFVQACIRLKNLTEEFKKFDKDRDGYITIGFEEAALRGLWGYRLMTKSKKSNALQLLRAAN